MAKNQNLIQKIFNGQLFTSEERKVDSEFITTSQNTSIGVCSCYQVLDNEKVYAKNLPKNILMHFVMFLKSIHLYAYDEPVSLNEKNIPDGRYLHVKIDDYDFFIPYTLIRKIAFIISRIDINKEKNKEYDFMNNMERDLKINLRYFPYKVMDFLLLYDDPELQRILNLLLANRYIHDKMLASLVTADDSGRIIKNLPKALAERIRVFISSSGISQKMTALSMFQLKSNMGEMYKDFGHEGLNRYHEIRSVLQSHEVYSFLRKKGIEKLVEPLTKNNALFQLFASVDNSELALLFKSEYSDFFLSHCSKRRKSMVFEEENYKKPVPAIDIIKSISVFFRKGFESEFESEKQDSELFFNYIRGLKGHNDFNLIFSKMSPLNFAVCFKPSNRKVQDYIVSKIKSPGKVYLKEFFDNNISTVAPLNKGWINEVREEFSLNAFILDKLGMVDYVKPDEKL